MAEGEATSWRPGVLASLLRFWIISVALIIVFAGVGFAAASTQVAKATAVASLVLSNPSDSSLSSDTGATYVNDQVAILKLPSTVDAASKLLARRLPGAQIDRQTFQDELSVSSGTNSQLVTVSITDTRPEVAQAATAALVDTYTQVATKLQSDTRTTQIATLQASIAALTAQVRVSPAVGAQQQVQIQLYQQQIASLSASGATAANIPSPAALPTAKRSIPPELGLIAGALVGLAAAIALSRILAQARQRFGGRFEPELIFSTPLLADVPSFSAERLPSDLPSVDSATSSVAEAYRFATTALTSRDVTVVAVVSATSGEGKSSCAANLAVTAAYQGARVLVVDADFEGKGVSFLLGQDRDRRQGLLDVLDGTVELGDVIVPLDLADNLSLLTGGTAAGYDWPDVLSTSRWPQLVARLSAAYDLVVIDLPPYLQIAYAVPIVRATDGVVIVIPHKSPVSRAAELAERLRFVGVEALGYLYVKAPLRRELGLVSRLATDEDRRPVKRGVTTSRKHPQPDAELAGVETAPLTREASADETTSTPEVEPAALVEELAELNAPGPKADVSEPEPEPKPVELEPVELESVEVEPVALEAVEPGIAVFERASVATESGAEQLAADEHVAPMATDLPGQSVSSVDAKASSQLTNGLPAEPPWDAAEQEAASATSVEEVAQDSGFQTARVPLLPEGHGDTTETEADASGRDHRGAGVDIAAQTASAHSAQDLAPAAEAISWASDVLPVGEASKSQVAVASARNESTRRPGGDWQSRSKR